MKHRDRAVIVEIVGSKLPLVSVESGLSNGSRAVYQFELSQHAFPVVSFAELLELPSLPPSDKHQLLSIY